jgi:hypothetical protein
MSNHESLRLLAANYRERAAETVNIEQRSRHLAFAEHCDRLATAMAPRPKRMATRLAGALLRRAARLAKIAQLAAHSERRRHPMSTDPGRASKPAINGIAHLEAPRRG